MRKKVSLYVLLGAALLASCTNSDYDLRGGVSMDMSIPGNRIALPIGDLRAYTLDSLLATDGQSLVVENGVYGLQLSDSIDPIVIPVELEPFHLDPIVREMPVDLGDLQLTTVEVPGVNQTLNLSLGELTKDEINSSLPVLREDASFSLKEEDFKTFQDLLALAGKDEIEINDFDVLITTGKKGISCDFTCPVPEEVKSFTNITFCERDGSLQGTEAGARIAIDLLPPAKAAGLDKTLNMEVVFPACYDLALDPRAEQAPCYTLNKGDLGNHNVLVISGLKCKDLEKTTVSFYAVAIKGMDSYVSQTDDGTVLDFHDKIWYSLEYRLSGHLTLTSADKASDYAVSLFTEDAIGIWDADIELNPITCPFEPLKHELGIELTGIEYIDSVGSITFNADASHITLATTLSRPIEGLQLDPSTPLVLRLPKSFDLELVGEGSDSRWNEAERTLVINQLDDLLNGSYEFAVKKLEVNKAVTDGTLTLDGDITVESATGQLTLTGGRTTLLKLMDNLGDRTLDVQVAPSTLEVTDVDVSTSQLSESVKDEVSFDIDIPVGTLIEKACAIYPKEDIDMTFSIGLKGLEKVDAKAHLDFTMDYPSFLCLETDERDMTVSDGKLHLDMDFDPNAGTLQRTLRVTHLDFTRLPGGCLEAVSVEDEGHLQLTSTLGIEGTITMDKTTVSLSDLDDELSFNAAISFGDFELKMFQGVVNYDVPAVNTDIDLRGDESLDVLFSEGNSMVLSDPQLFIDLDNPIGVPVVVNMLLEGLDENGTVIPTSTIEVNNVRIEPARYDEAAGGVVPTTTRLLFASKATASVSGYTTVVCENLANLLKVVPSKVHIELKPGIDRSSMHSIDIGRPLEISASYRVAIPLCFDDLHLCYRTASDGIALSLGDYSQYLSKAAIRLKANAIQTIPFGMKLSLVPYDGKGRVMENVRISTVELAAGTGAAVSREAPSQPIEFEIVSDDCNLADLVSLQVVAEVNANHTEGGVALKPEQGIMLTDMVLYIEADVELDLNDK